MTVTLPARRTHGTAIFGHPVTADSIIVVRSGDVSPCRRPHLASDLPTASLPWHRVRDIFFVLHRKVANAHT